MINPTSPCRGKSFKTGEQNVFRKALNPPIWIKEMPFENFIDSLKACNDSKVGQTDAYKYNKALESSFGKYTGNGEISDLKDFVSKKVTRKIFLKIR